MSGFEAGAAVIGVFNVAIHRISSFYDFAKALKEAPVKIVKASNEVDGLIQCLAGVKTFESARQDVQEQASRIGLADAVNQCGEACAHFEHDLRHWTRSGVQSLSSKLRFACNRAKVERYRAEITRAKGTVVLAVSTTTLSLLLNDQLASETNIRTQTAVLMTDIRRLTAEAEVQRQSSERIAEQLCTHLEEEEEEENSADSEIAIGEILKQQEVVEMLRTSCSAVKRELQVLGSLSIIVGDMVAEENSKNEAGVPQSAINQVKQFQVGNMTARQNSSNRVGIFPG